MHIHNEGSARGSSLAEGAWAWSPLSLPQAAATLRHNMEQELPSQLIIDK